MKLNVIADRDGVIVGTAPISPKAGGHNAPSGIAITPASGRAIYELDIPKEAMALDPADLTRLYRVRLQDRPTLVRVAGQPRTTRQKPAPKRRGRSRR